MGYRNLRVRRRPRTSRPTRPHRGRDRPAPRSRRDPAPGLRAGGPALFFARVKGTAFPMVSNLFGTLDADALPVPRHARRRAQAGRAEGRSRRTCAAGRGGTGTCRSSRGGLRPKFVRSGPVLAHATTVSQLPQLKCWPLDGGRVRHAAAGLHRGPRPARLAEVEPRHVPRAALRQRVRAGPRGRAALPDPPRHRRPPRGGGAARRAVAGERRRRRPAGADAGGRDAAAGGAARAGVRRRAGRAGGCGRLRAPVGHGLAADARRGRLRHHREHRPDRARSPKGRSATTSATTASRTTSRC